MAKTVSRQLFASRLMPWAMAAALLLVTGLLVSVSQAWAAQEEGGRYYRYKDDKGNTVVSTSIPKEFVAKGYDILSGSFKLLQTVEPHVILSDEQKAAKLALQQQRVQDQYLLKSYSSVKEIEAARDRKLESLSRDIALIEDNLKNTRLQRQQEERKAADAQRGGRAVSQAVINMLSQLERREVDAQQAMAQRRDEFEQESKRYQAYITRYQQLTQ